MILNSDLGNNFLKMKKDILKGDKRHIISKKIKSSICFSTKNT